MNNLALNALRSVSPAWKALQERKEASRISDARIRALLNVLENSTARLRAGNKAVAEAAARGDFDL